MKSPFFTFRYHTAKPLGAPQWLIAFTADPALDVPEFWKMIEEAIARDLWPSALILIVRENVSATFAKNLTKLLKQTADWRAGLNRTPVVVVGFDAFGRCAMVHECNAGLSLSLDESRFDALLAQGLRTLFLRRDGLLEAPTSSHFVYPSGKHGEAFIRVANILMYGPEISFVGLGLLRHLHPDSRYVLIDTSSIASVALAAVVLRVQLNAAFKPPVISSFSSWAALRLDTDFPAVPGLTVVISASTSGNMAREIRDKKRVPEQQIVTLFSLAEDRGGTQIVCDLSADIGGPAEWEIARRAEYGSAQACALCRSGSKSITFVGDQFLADAVTYAPVEVHQRDAPDLLSEQMEAFYGHGAFYLKNSGSGTAVDEFFVDIPTLMKRDRFQSFLTAAVVRHVPASAGLIVSPGDPDSDAMASRVQEMLRSFTQKTVPMVAAKDLASDAPTIDAEASIVVVTAAIDTGSQIQAIDRSLRDPYGTRPRIFLTGLIKHQNASGTSHVLKDLEFSGTSHRHGVIKIEEMVLPPRPQVSAWAAEWNLFSRLIDELAEPPKGCNKEALAAFRARMEDIDRLGEGASDCLFWRSPESRPLRLRQTFAFWNFKYDPERAGQGDVLGTIASVLQNVREGRRPKMSQSAFHQSVIAPTMFSRYNDGIIQAALLRCALPHEIDYSGSRALSRDMGAMLAGFFAASDEDAGEALYEFLVSIASGRLKLCQGDLDLALAAIADTDPVVEALVSLCRVRDRT